MLRACRAIHPIFTANMEIEPPCRAECGDARRFREFLRSVVLIVFPHVHRELCVAPQQELRA